MSSGSFSKPGCEVRIASRHPETLGSANDTVLLPNSDAPAAAFLAMMQDITHVVHCAALNSDAGNAGEADYLAANGALTGQLARAAAARASGRFIYLSSIRAVVGPGFSGTIDEATIPAPQCAYGRSKREGEIRTLEAYASRPSDAAVLRLPPVYGERHERKPGDADAPGGHRLAAAGSRLDGRAVADVIRGSGTDGFASVDPFGAASSRLCCQRCPAHPGRGNHRSLPAGL